MGYAITLMETTLTIFTDGGARGNPGPSAVGVVMKAGEWGYEHERCIGDATNNVAEYTAVIDALELVSNKAGGMPEIMRLEFFLDSELVVKQLNGQYRVKDPGLSQLYQNIQRTLRDASYTYSFTHVRREQNKRADQLVNHALDVQAGTIQS
jgi:ribonuclease HI